MNTIKLYKITSKIIQNTTYKLIDVGLSLPVGCATAFFISFASFDLEHEQKEMVYSAIPMGWLISSLL